jgi:hypothetical protein
VRQTFPGCHGVAVTPASLGLELGWLSERPPAAVEVELVGALERAAGAELVWQLDEPAGFGLPPITSQTWQERGDRVWIGNTLNLSLRLDYRRNLVSIAAKNGNLQVTLEALANLALPLVAQRSGALVLHGSAASRDGSALMLCAESGSGKSSLLMGLAAAGWEPLSEDQCTVDLDPGGRHRVWPGPSWVRLKNGSIRPPLVADQVPRFEAVDKAAWDISPHVAHAPAALARIVLLEPPGGSEAVWEPLSETDLIGALTAHATWFQRPDAYEPVVLPGLVKLGMSVPGFRMRLPTNPDWLDRGVALIAEH